MEIVTYRELEPKDDIMMLIDLAFWWPISPKTMEERIAIDTRLKNSPVGFCAVEDDRLVGFVGVMDIPTRTVEGVVELIGGIWAVAPIPVLQSRESARPLWRRLMTIFAHRITASPSSAPFVP